MLRTLCGALLAFAVALGLPQDADAEPREFVFPGFHSAEFRVPGSNGYDLVVSYFNRREISVIATKGRTSASHRVPWRPYAERGFEAKLPGLGRIAVEFQPLGKPRRLTPFPGCEGRPGSRQRGVFAGTIRFRGERGYTAVEASRAHGSMVTSYRETCRGESGGRSEEAQPAIDLIAMAPKGRVAFSATLFDFGHSEIPPRLMYLASHFRRSPGMEVVRLVHISREKVDSLTAEHSGRAAAAHVAAAAPFTGSAAFAVEPGGGVTWTGDLSVSFPGTGPVRLTGKRFKARLCVGQRCAGDRLGAASSAAPTPRPWPR